MSDWDRFMDAHPGGDALLEEDEGIQVEPNRFPAVNVSTAPVSSWPLQQQKQLLDGTHTAAMDWPNQPTMTSPPHGSANVDAIAFALSKQHLRSRPDGAGLHSSSASTVAVTVAVPSTQSWGQPSASTTDTGPAYKEASPPPYRAASSAGPSLSVADTEIAAKPIGDEESLILRTAIANHNRRLRRQASSRFPSAITSNTQGLRRVQSHADNASFEPGQPVEFRPLPMSRPPISVLHDFGRMQIDSPTLTVDEELDFKVEEAESSTGRPLVTHHATEGLIALSDRLPRYRSSAEAAARCQNLVRSRPRMRKRTKLRDKQSNSAISAAAAKSTST